MRLSKPDLFVQKKVPKPPSQIGKSNSLMDVIRSPLNHWKPMTSNEEFIVLFMADTFLTHDYEQVLRVAMEDYSYVANSPLFEANLLRFLALASFKAFEHAIQADLNSL